MEDAEAASAVVVGLVGLVAFVAGSMLVQAPRIDVPVHEAVGTLVSRRRSVLVGALTSTAGATLLLWPITFVAAADGDDVWRSLALFSVAVGVAGFAFLSVATLGIAALAWREATSDSVNQFVLDVAHLATWSVSSPVGAVSVVATTAVAVQAQIAGVVLVLAAALKVLTVVVEVVGTPERTGWNAGGWAAGSSGYATVAWFLLLLVAIA